MLSDQHVSTWEVLHHLLRALDADGIAGAGAFLQSALARSAGDVDEDLVKELAHLLYRVAEQKAWTKEAIAFNNLVTSWADITAMVGDPIPASTQDAFTFEEDD